MPNTYYIHKKYILYHVYIIFRKHTKHEIAYEKTWKSPKLLRLKFIKKLNQKFRQ